MTGRFTTKQASNLLQVTLANGTTFTGTDTHPVWVENLGQWTAIGDLTPGDLVDTSDSLVEVSAFTVPGYADQI